MNILESQLCHIGADRLSIVTDYPDAYHLFCSRESQLYANTCERKPETSPRLHLLGILTKTHLELSCMVETHLDSRRELKRALTQSIAQHHNKFHDVQLEELALITHLWLYVQGYLHMDFSLANDHAAKCASLIAQICNLDQHQQRTNFMASFYHGQHAAPSSTLSLFKRWLTFCFGSNRP
ncbi:hypothetical protein HGP28_17060 [Vibrio sp. SM6]|uniref:Uncharacterized protein n=1 Tax=Vibrio agarilyticus TaxID=2726741 RepID=A0A7X8YHX8_9VIBR|nr:hypothetical protein [Vibrio agarilyticus]NLS14573.1 hypothetical protein [Vibrio agarilyticus]